MRTICLYFEIHQIIHLKRYRFFDIGTDHYYYDDYANETSINDVGCAGAVGNICAGCHRLVAPAE